MRKLLLTLLTSILCFPVISFAQFTSDCGYAGTALTVGATCSTVAFNSTNATNFWDLASGCAAGDEDDAWWWFTATSTYTSITYNSANDAILHVFTGVCSPSMTALACSDATASGDETITLSTTVGVNYAIRIQKKAASNNMNGTICVFNPPPIITIGTGTSTTSNPYTGFYHDARTQYIITKDELVAAGFCNGSTFTSLAFNVSSKGSTAAYTGFTIQLGHTASSNFAAVAWLTPHGQMFIVPIGLLPQVGILTPFQPILLGME